MYIIISKECESCGGKIAIKKFNRKPTQKEIEKVEYSLGKKNCIESRIINLSGSEIIKISFD